MEIFEFKPFDGIALSPLESKNIVDNKATTINLERDIGLYKENNGKVIIYFSDNIFEIDKEVLKHHMDRRSVLLINKNQDYYEAEVRTPNNYYKLVPIESGVTLEINGIHMHRIKGVNPLEDAKRKVRLARIRPGSNVLEIGTGLGYTTINSLKIGARKIVTIEKDENVLWLSERNPWSKELSSNKITIVVGDAFSILKEINMKFDNIIHDPPRLTSSSISLYSKEFYENLFRLLKPKGVLFHYTGEPGRTKGKSLSSKVASNLKSIGFNVIGYDKYAMGIIAIKG
ncbi:MAG: methyltransferase [Caldisphaera sp.]